MANRPLQFPDAAPRRTPQKTRRAKVYQHTLILLLILALQAPLALCAQSLAFEYAVKATYLYKFAPFVEWPASAFADAGSTFNICVAGQDPFGNALDQAVNGEHIAAHPIAVRRLGDDDADLNCQVLYIGRPQRQRGPDWLMKVKDKPVLTVTDQNQGGTGGMIHFLIVDGRVRFSVDTVAANASGLTVSSKLLSLAVSIRRPS
jgi:hypothetical protein